jgi:hypothetical protein
VFNSYRYGAVTSSPPKATADGSKAGKAASKAASSSLTTAPKRTVLQVKRIPDERLMTRWGRCTS